jgi:hypothetical protein
MTPIGVLLHDQLCEPLSEPVAACCCAWQAATGLGA